jgi:class 3 adenylate cyclase
MATRTWKKERASDRIAARIKELPLNEIEVKELVRETDLTNLPRRVAYRIDGVHLYADILNLSDMLHLTEVEGETCHAVHRILQRVDAIFVDFHNQRLHSVVAKPYDSEAKRVQRAVAIAHLIINVLAQTGEDADHPAAKVRVGIDTGKALAVNNGRRGHREPLFLGEPANHAAKRACGGKSVGIFLTNEARAVLGLKNAPNEDTTALGWQEIRDCEDKAKLGVTADEIVKEWKDDLENNPIGSFEFKGHTPPFSTLGVTQK